MIPFGELIQGRLVMPLPYQVDPRYLSKGVMSKLLRCKAQIGKKNLISPVFEPYPPDANITSMLLNHLMATVTARVYLCLYRVPIVQVLSLTCEN